MFILGKYKKDIFFIYLIEIFIDLLSLLVSLIICREVGGYVVGFVIWLTCGPAPWSPSLSRLHNNDKENTSEYQFFEPPTDFEQSLCEIRLGFRRKRETSRVTAMFY